MTDTSFTQRSASGLIVDRRELMMGAAALGLSMGALGTMGAPAMAADEPKKGGTLRLGMEGGGPSDSLDPRTYADSIPINYSLQVCNCLVEINDEGLAVGELFESWEAKPGAKEWIFNCRKGITFHSGKTFDADDAIYSLNLHRGETKSGAKDMVSSITDIKKLSATQVQITLKDGNLDLPYNLAIYQLIVVPNGFSDWKTLDGTGAYKLEKFQPGQRVVTKATGNYWKTGRGNYDGIELQYILDANSRIQALLAGEVDAINRIDPKSMDQLEGNDQVASVRTKASGNRLAFVALCDNAPYDSLDTRLALKYGIDRKAIVDTVYQGYATVANDTTVSPMQRFYAKDLPQRPFDPDKAAFHYKKAGSPKMELKVSDAVFSGSVDAGVLFQESMKKAGIDLAVTRVSGDGYWSNIWLKDPFSFVYWGGRPTIDTQLSQTFLSDANWNDTHWKRPEFDKLVIAARVEADEAKRTAIYAEAQKMISDDGGMVCYAVADYLDGYSTKVKGAKPHPRYDMCDQRVCEKTWFA